MVVTLGNRPLLLIVFSPPTRPRDDALDQTMGHARLYALCAYRTADENTAGVVCRTSKAFSWLLPLNRRLQLLEQLLALVLGHLGRRQLECPLQCHEPPLSLHFVQ